MRPAATTARVHFPNGRTRIVLLEELPAPGRQLIGTLPYGRWICEGLKRTRSTTDPGAPVQYEVWLRLED